MLSQAQINRPHQIVKTITGSTFSQAKLAMVERHYSVQCSLAGCQAGYGPDHKYTKFWQGELDRLNAALAELEVGGVVA